MEILQYMNKKTVLHGLAPKTKIFFVLSVLVTCVISTDVLTLASIVSLLFLLAALSGLRGEVSKQLPMLLMMSLSITVLTAFTLQGGDYLISSLPITTGGIEFGVVLSLRFVALIMAFQMLVLTTQPRDIVYSLQGLRLPVDYTLMFLIALRFIPTLQLEGQRIHEAQLSRGYNPGGGLRGKVRSLAPIVVPLVSNALAKANVLGLTIDMRGYRSAKRVSARPWRLSGLDFLALSLTIIGLILYSLATFALF